MRPDIYTKVILTVIGGALSILAWQSLTTPASAVADCGFHSNPCYVRTNPGMPLDMRK